ncbi:MAG: SagB/ThcOx family dehydrogenase [Dehalococcoidia bacterium]
MPVSPIPPTPVPAADSLPFEFVLHEEVLVSYVLDVALSVPGQSHRRTECLDPTAPLLPATSRPSLALGTRIYVDEAGAVRLCPPIEPRLEPKRDYFLALCFRRELAVTGDLALLWRLLGRLDGCRTTAELLAALPPADGFCAARLLAELAAAGVVDVSGRPTAKFVHDATKRGAVVTQSGAATASDFYELTMNGAYRSYPEAPQIALSTQIPERLAAFHTLTRQRRSGKGFSGAPVARADLEALLLTACGVTGTVTEGERTLELRAYPAGGALYGVELYPVVLAVTDLAPALYHYRVVEHTLERLRPTVPLERLLATTVPLQREYLRGVAAVLCLTANFPRFESKYGQQGYRALAAEAGVIAQNLILAATALGLRARPIGGFFDDLLNPVLGLDPAQEQFLLAVLLGHPDPTGPAPPPE